MNFWDNILACRGYGYGSGFINADHDMFFLNIPKNASSYLATVLPQCGWTSAQWYPEEDPRHQDISWHQVQHLVVALRHPWRRWISGVAQYIHTYILNPRGYNNPLPIDFGPGLTGDVMWAQEFIDSYSPIVERLIFDNLSRLDDHVWPQNEFFQNLLITTPRRYLFIDYKFDRQLEELGVKPDPAADRNRGSANPEIQILQEFFERRLMMCPELSLRVFSAYQIDYQIINNEFGRQM
jgi:hypothetical protein